MQESGQDGPSVPAATPSTTAAAIKKGTSCHQCKNTKPVEELLFCKNNFDKRSRPGKRQCRKKYCASCLSKFYTAANKQLITSSSICAACRKICSCAACSRARNKNKAAEKASTGATMGLSLNGQPMFSMAAMPNFSQSQQAAIHQHQLEQQQRNAMHNSVLMNQQSLEVGAQLQNVFTIQSDIVKELKRDSEMRTLPASQVDQLHSNLVHSQHIISQLSHIKHLLDMQLKTTQQFREQHRLFLATLDKTRNGQSDTANSTNSPQDMSPQQQQQQQQLQQGQQQQQQNNNSGQEQQQRQQPQGMNTDGKARLTVNTQAGNNNNNTMNFFRSPMFAEGHAVPLTAMDTALDTTDNDSDPSSPNVPQSNVANRMSALRDKDAMTKQNTHNPNVNVAVQYGNVGMAMKPRDLEPSASNLAMYTPKQPLDTWGMQFTPNPTQPAHPNLMMSTPLTRNMGNNGNMLSPDLLSYTHDGFSPVSPLGMIFQQRPQLNQGMMMQSPAFGYSPLGNARSLGNNNNFNVNAPVSNNNNNNNTNNNNSINNNSNNNGNNSSTADSSMPSRNN